MDGPTAVIALALVLGILVVVGLALWYQWTGRPRKRR